MDGVCMTTSHCCRGPWCCLRLEPDILGSVAVSGGVACRLLHTELSPDIPSKQRESAELTTWGHHQTSDSGQFVRHHPQQRSDYTRDKTQVSQVTLSRDIKSASEYYSQLCKCEIQMIVLCLCQLTTDVTPPDADEMQ